MAAKRTEEILRRLDEVYGTEYICYLNHETPWQLLIAVILSAQCTDARVNMVTPDLFKEFPTAEKMAKADIKRVDGVFRVFAKGGRENTGMEAIQWICRCVDNGAGEVVVNSIDTDGVKQGIDIEMLTKVCDTVAVPVIASGGAGGIDHFTQLFKSVPKVSAGLAASIFHFGEVSIQELKEVLAQNDINVRR